MRNQDEPHSPQGFQGLVKAKQTSFLPEEEAAGSGRQVTSCGVLVFRTSPRRQFLLLRYRNRYDLPKGHMETGETELQCALRELREETGIQVGDVQIDPSFRFQTTYNVTGFGRYRDNPVAKTVVIFLGQLLAESCVRCTEHSGFEWIDWNPPHRLQKFTVDPLLAAAAEHLGNYE